MSLSYHSTSMGFMYRDLPPEPEQFHLWMETLIRGHKICHTLRSATPSDFEKICSISNLKPVMKEMTSRVGTPAFCRHVRLNLQLAKLRKKWSLEKEGCSDVSWTSVSFKQAAVVRAESDVAYVAQELARRSEKLEEIRASINEEHQRRLLLEAVTAQLTTHCRQTSQQLQSVQRALQHWKDKLHVQSLTPNAEHQECTIRELLAGIIELRVDLMHEEESHGDSQLIQAKHKLWSRVAELSDWTCNRSPLSTLTKLARAQADNVLNLTASTQPSTVLCSIREELQEKGELQRETDQSVKEILALMSAAHIESHLQSEERKAQAAGHLTARSTITAHLLDTVEHKYSNATVSSALSAVLQSSIKAAGERAALQQLHAISARLQKESAEAEQEAEALHRLQETVSALEQAVRRDGQHLESVWRVKERCQDAISESTSECKASVFSALSGLQNPAPALPLSVLQREMNDLSSLSMSLLSAVKLKNGNVVLEQDLRIRDLRTSVREPLQRLLCKIGRIHEKETTAERLCADVMDAHVRLASLTARNEHTRHAGSLCRSSTVPALSSAAIKALCEEVDDHDEKLEHKVKTTLQTCSTLIEQTRRALPRSQQALEAWWDQPATKIKL